MSLQELFSNNIKNNRLFSGKDRLLLAVSGGVDSVVLCELCKQAGFEFVIAHCNFQLREEESERDERFVRTLGEKYGVDVRVKAFDTESYAAEKKVSIQVAARELRYDWFNQLITAGGVAKYILTAHHADDNAETVLMNFCRGTGLHGLTGIPAKAGPVRRPLLAFSKGELLAFAAAHQLDFVEDSSNRSSKYTRNLFRNEVIPLIEKAYPQVKENLQDNIRRFRETEQLYLFATGELKKKLFSKKNSEIHIPVKQLLSFQSRALIFDIIAEFGFSERQVDEVLKLAQSDSGKYIQAAAGAFRMIRHRHWFIISPAQAREADNIVIEKSDREIMFPPGRLRLETIPAAGFDGGKNTSTAHAYLDAGEIEFPLLLRRWKQGDYFYPFGMKKKKKLSRFFIDQKLSKTEKEQAWVLEMNEKIIWVVGQRIDERFKVTGKTQKIVRITSSLYT